MPTPKKILTLPLRLSIALLLLGMLLQILELPLGREIILLAFIATGTLYPFRFWKKTEKEFLDYTKLILVVFWATNGVFKTLDLPYTLFLQIIIAVTFLIWMLFEGTAYFLDEDRKSKNKRLNVLWNCAMVIGTFAIIGGSLLHMLGWSLAIPLMVLGILIIVAYILKDFFTPNNLKEGEANSGEFQL